MSRLAMRMAEAKPSATKAATARAKALEAEGRDIIVLSQGEPDFDTPEYICEAAIAAIRDGHTRYTPVAGIGALRDAIAAKLKRDNGLSYAADAITVGCGAKQVLFNAMLATLDPGDEVIVPSPCWVSYPEMARLAGGQPVIVPCTANEGYKLSPERLEQAISRRSRWLVLNSPGNPTGAVYNAQELRDLAAVLERHPGIWVMCDDIYEKLVYPPTQFQTIAAVAPELGDRTLVVNGVSKANCMTGWRVGYGAGPIDLIKAMNTIQGQTTSHTSSISQYAALAALNGPESEIDRVRARFLKRRNLVLEQIRNTPGLNCVTPQGAFYVFPDCSELIGTFSPSGQCLETDSDVATYLLEEAGVGVVPGDSFLAPGHFRLSYASSDEDLQRACERIRAACGRLIGSERISLRA